MYIFPFSWGEREYLHLQQLLGSSEKQLVAELRQAANLSPCEVVKVSAFFHIISPNPSHPPRLQLGAGLLRAGEEMLGFTPNLCVECWSCWWVDAFSAVGTEERWNTWSTKAISANEAWPVSLHGREVASWAFWQWMATRWPCARHMTYMTWRRWDMGLVELQLLLFTVE